MRYKLTQFPLNIAFNPLIVKLLRTSNNYLSYGNRVTYNALIELSESSHMHNSSVFSLGQFVLHKFSIPSSPISLKYKSNIYSCSQSWVMVVKFLTPADFILLVPSLSTLN